MVYMKVFGKGNAVSVRVSKYSSYLGFELSGVYFIKDSKRAQQDITLWITRGSIFLEFVYFRVAKLICMYFTYTPAIYRAKLDSTRSSDSLKKQTGYDIRHHSPFIDLILVFLCIREQTVNGKKFHAKINVVCKGKRKRYTLKT